MVLSLACDVSELEKLCELPTERALLREAVPFLARLVRDPAFVATEILSHLEEAKNTGAWYVVCRYDDVNGAYSLQVFVWPPGTGTRVHDHSSWGLSAVPQERYSKSATSVLTAAPG